MDIWIGKQQGQTAIFTKEMCVDKDGDLSTKDESNISVCTAYIPNSILGLKEGQLVKATITFDDNLEVVGQCKEDNSSKSKRIAEEEIYFR